MATEQFSWIKSGPISGNCLYYRADAANLTIWGPVVVKPAASGYYISEAGSSTTAADPTVLGVAVGPLRDSTNSYVNTAAGEMISVCVWGICKVKVDGNADNIADGDALVHHNAAGVAQLAAIDAPNTYAQATLNTLFNHIMGSFAMALEASTADGDVIPAFVYGARGTRT
jgi:hypothetical protein